MDNQRLILFVALSVMILMLWSAWEKENQPAPVATPEARQEVPVAPAGGKVVGKAPEVQAAASRQLESSERIRVETDLLFAEIDTQGGDLRTVDLRKHPVSIDKGAKPVRLLDDQGSEIFVAQSGLLARDLTLANHKTRFSSDARSYVLATGQDRLEVRLNWSGPEGLRISKIYNFHRNSYQVDITYEISNAGRQARDVYLYAQFLRHHIEQGMSLTTLPSYTGGVIYTHEKKYEKINFEDMRTRKLEREAEGGWVAMLQHYFLGAWLPNAGERHQYYSDSFGNNTYVIGYKTLTPTPVAAGSSARLNTALFVGPKEQHRLEKIDETLKLTVDYGWLTFISAPLFWLLEWLHKLVSNWGWAIILLTVLIKLVFYPLSVVSYRSMAQMRKLQPKMQSIKERYGDDRQKQQQAMMELYKSEKINPLGGCLPILIQIPVFLALYWVLLESVELRQAPFALWLQDLSTPDPYFVLPVLMGLSMLAQQWLNPQPLDPLQKKVMYALPVVFTFMFLFFPSGLVLYWVVQNVLSIAQQWQINRAVEAQK